MESAKKWISTRGVGGGLETHILGQISYFTPFFIDFGAGVCICEVKESIFRGFVKSDLRSRKIAVLCQIKVRGHFC